MKKLLIFLILVFLPFQVFAIEKWECNDVGFSFLQCGGPLVPSCSNDCTFENLRELICNLVRFFTNCLAQIALIFGLAFGGFQIMTAAGDPRKLELGKMAIGGSIIGFLIVVLASEIINLILSL